MFKANNIHCTIPNGTEILKGLNFEVNPGEIHAIMGPNGSGKSSFTKVVAGHPDYELTQGELTFNGKDISQMPANERGLEGLFIGFQYPIEIPGVNNAEFLKMALNAKRKYLEQDDISDEEFESLLNEKMALLDMEDKYRNRGLNQGFSGGEKKRNEILQLAMLDPKLAILDETDSGLDIDALKIVSNGINKVMSKDKAVILITHYQRLLDFVKPDFVHVLRNGQIIKSGGPELALELEAKGYDWLV